MTGPFTIEIIIIIIIIITIITIRRTIGLIMMMIKICKTS